MGRPPTGQGCSTTLALLGRARICSGLQCRSGFSFARLRIPGRRPIPRPGQRARAGRLQAGGRVLVWPGAWRRRRRSALARESATHLDRRCRGGRRGLPHGSAGTRSSESRPAAARGRRVECGAGATHMCLHGAACGRRVRAAHILATGPRRADIASVAHHGLARRRPHPAAAEPAARRQHALRGTAGAKI